MPSKDDLLHLQHTLDANVQIEDFTASLDLPSFEHTPLVKPAVERLLQNILRHEYNKLIAKTVWQTVIDELPPLRNAVENALASLQRLPMDQTL